MSENVVVDDIKEVKWNLPASLRQEVNIEAATRDINPSDLVKEILTDFFNRKKEATLKEINRLRKV